MWLIQRYDCRGLPRQSYRFLLTSPKLSHRRSGTNAVHRLPPVGKHPEKEELTFNQGIGKHPEEEELTFNQEIGKHPEEEEQMFTPEV